MKYNQKKKIMSQSHPKQHDKTSDKDEKEEKDPVIVMPQITESHPRIVGLYGVIEESKCANIIANLYQLNEMGKNYIPVNPEDPEGDYVVINEPIEFIIKTEGGAVTDMFSVYDVMRELQKNCDISTFGIGNVMSAGVLLLAAGTKGQRRVGRNCRLMIHQISGGNYGHLEDLENSLAETTWFQERYIEELSSLTKLTKNKIKNIFKKKLDFYFSAEEAVKFGIVDSIV